MTVWTPKFLNAQTYCTGEIIPSDCASTIYNLFLTNVYTEDAVIDLSNLDTDCGIGSSGYSDYTDMSATVLEGSIFKLHVQHGTHSYYGGYHMAWIDWNQDGEFSSSEKVIGTGWVNADDISTATITVPMGTPGGETRMRVMTTEGSTSDGPCAYSSSWAMGEIEDYTIIVIPLTACDELDLTAGTLTDMEVCGSTPFTIINEGTIIASEVDRVWQRRVPIGTGTWTTIPGAVSANYTSAGITEEGDYRCIVTCSVTGDSDTTNIAVVTLKSAMECYCPGGIITAVCSSTIYNLFLENVYTEDAIIDLSNMGTACATGSGGYSDYTDLSATVMENTTFQLKVKHGTHSSYGGYRMAWIDWNMDGVFSASEKVLSSDWLSASAVSTATITVPLGITEGATRMRVMTTEGSISDGPCTYSYSWAMGEVEDYTINLLRMPDCDTMEIHAGVLSSASICPSTAFTIVSESPTIAAGIQRVWQKRETGATEWTDIPGGFFLQEVPQ